MVPKQTLNELIDKISFRAVLFRMVPKHVVLIDDETESFRAVLFRMVPKLTFALKT